MVGDSSINILLSLQVGPLACEAKQAFQVFQIDWIAALLKSELKKKIEQIR